MNDLISREAVLQICREKIWNGADDYDEISARGIAERVKALPSVQPEVIACGSGELNDETGMEWVSNAGMVQAGEIHGSVLKTIPIFGEDTNDE